MPLTPTRPLKTTRETKSAKNKKRKVKPMKAFKRALTMRRHSAGYQLKGRNIEKWQSSDKRSSGGVSLTTTEACFALFESLTI